HSTQTAHTQCKPVCVHMFVCMYACICSCVCMCACICSCVCMCACICSCMCAGICSCAFVCVRHSKRIRGVHNHGNGTEKERHVTDSKLALAKQRHKSGSISGFLSCHC